MTTKSRHRLPAIACPHCGSRMITRSSNQVTPLVRESRLDCDNPDCDFVATGQIALVSTRRRSKRPRAGVELPVRPANDETPRPANDDALPDRQADERMTN